MARLARLARPQTPLLPVLLLVVLLLGGCAGAPQRDGPDARPPSGLERVPDAEPRVEPIRAGGPNKPYQVLGQSYVPLTGDAALAERGLASWYGRKFHGRPTANGETYDMYAMTAAHKTMPLPSYARVRNPANGREVIVRVNDRGPFAAGRVIDLSYTAALRLGLLGGVAPVELRRITHAEIRAGLVRPVDGPALAALPVEDPAPSDRRVADSPGFWLQLGAFRQREAAAQLQQRTLQQADATLPGVALREEEGWIRVQAGPYATRAEAERAAERLRASIGVAPLLIQRP